MKTQPKINPGEIRRSLHLNQVQFWAPLAVTQSGGSRYEGGRAMPKPVCVLLELLVTEKNDERAVKKLLALRAKYKRGGA